MDSVIRRLQERQTPLTVKEVAELLQLSRDTVYGMVQRGSIPFTKLGGALRFDPESLTKWVGSMSYTPGKQGGRRL